MAPARRFPDLFYIASPGFSAGGAYHHATWSGISGDNFHGRFAGADFTLVDNEWLDRNIRSKGPLGAEYPALGVPDGRRHPAFLNLINNGLSDPEHPDWGGWGGRYELYTPRTAEVAPRTGDATDLDRRRGRGAGRRRPTGTRTTTPRSGAGARPIRTTSPRAWTGRSSPTPRPTTRRCRSSPIPTAITAKPGERVDLSAEGSTDPDGDALSYEWFYYGEAGTLAALERALPASRSRSRTSTSRKAWFTVPTDRVMPPGTGTMHIILAVTDHGTPAAHALPARDRRCAALSTSLPKARCARAPGSWAGSSRRR